METNEAGIVIESDTKLLPIENKEKHDCGHGFARFIPNPNHREGVMGDYTLAPINEVSPKPFKSAVDMHMQMWADKLKNVKLPRVGKKVIFYDDGKFGRPYNGIVCAVLTKAEGEYQIVSHYNEEHGREISDNLINVFEYNKREYSWIWGEDTDYFIGVAIPDYDEHIIWCARDKYNGWFSMDIQTDWQGGRLDVDGTLTKEIEKERKEYGKQK